jgi:hypothetical protein
MKRQHGLVLLPMTLALALVAVVAYGMTRDGAMNVSAVDAQFDTERARYLAEAGVNLVKWRNQQLGCDSALGFTRAVTDVEGGTIMANTADVFARKRGLSMTLTATTARGAVKNVVIDDAHAVQVYDFSKKTEVTVAGQSGSDTYIRSDAATSSNAKFLEVTDGKAHGLVKFGLNGIDKNVLLGHADLMLYQTDSKSTQPVSLGIHRLTRDFGLLTNWYMGWNSPGGDYEQEAAATIPITGNGQYTTDVANLVAGWIANPPANYGMLLKPHGLTEAHFSSFEASSNPPRLFLRYYPLCK